MSHYRYGIGVDGGSGWMKVEAIALTTGLAALVGAGDW